MISAEMAARYLASYFFAAFAAGVFFAALATIALLALPYAAGDRPVAIDRTLSYGAVAVVGGIGLLIRVIDLATKGALALPDKAPGLWLSAVGLIVLSRAVYDLARERNGLVIGTENRSEYYLGYFTRFGDAASDVEPIWDLYKTEVKLAAELMGQPEAVLVKHPTAGLWGGQTDEDELGFTYREADLAIVCLEELKLDVDGAAAHSGVDRDVVERVKARVDAVAWKHHVPHAL